MDEKVFPPVAYPADPAAAGEPELPRGMGGQPGCTGLAEQHGYGLTQPGRVLVLIHIVAGQLQQPGRSQSVGYF